MTVAQRVVAAYLDHLAIERGLAANTLSSYARDLRRYAQHLAQVGRTDLREVGEQHVAAFLARLREGDAEHRPLAASSAGRTLVAVRGLHRFLALEGDLDADPARRVSPPTPPSRLPKAIGVTEVERLLEAAERGMWAEPDPATLDALREVFLRAEGDLEG